MTPIRLWFQKFSEAWTACMVCMVEGDLSVLTLDHALVASQTGAGCGTAVALSYVLGIKNRWTIIWLTGVMTMFTDFLVHPTHFGPEMMEAVVTGLGAMMLAIITSRYLREKN